MERGLPRQYGLSTGWSEIREDGRVTWPTIDLHWDPSSATSFWFWANGLPTVIPRPFVYEW